MITELQNVLIFKTNIQDPQDVGSLKSILENTPHIHAWSIDTEDVDCVLRIVSSKLTTDTIIHLITNHGYECCELES